MVCGAESLVVVEVGVAKQSGQILGEQKHLLLLLLLLLLLVVVFFFFFLPVGANKQNSFILFKSLPLVKHFLNGSKIERKDAEGDQP